jgi:hypothetical protein
MHRVNSAARRRRRSTGGALVLISGGAAAIALGLTRRSIEETVTVLGAAYVGAWIIERRGQRHLASGAVLLGLGMGLVLSDHSPGYRDELIFAGIAGGLLACQLLAPGSARGAAGALAGVAVSEWARTWLPPRVHAPGIYRAFDDGWAFGIALATFGLAAMGAAWRSGRRVA